MPSLSSGSRPCNQEHWPEVRFGSPCPVCNRNSWCAVSPDGMKVRCRRQPIGAYREGKDRNGAPYYMHALGTAVTPPPPLPASTVELADLGTRHRVNRRILQCLLLSERHRRELRARGLSDQQID